MFRGRDPSVNVVLLEDAAAVVGVVIAASCITLSHYTGSSVPDAVGSLLIGSLLGGVASFIIYTNTLALVGKYVSRRCYVRLRFSPLCGLNVSEIQISCLCVMECDVVLFL